MKITNLFLSDKEVHIDYLHSEPCFYTGIKPEYNQLPTSWFEFPIAKTLCSSSQTCSDWLQLFAYAYKLDWNQL